MARVSKKKATSKKAAATANLDFEAKLWLAADKLRNNMDAAGSMHCTSSQWTSKIGQEEPPGGTTAQGIALDFMSLIEAE